MNELFYETNRLRYEIPLPVKKALTIITSRGYCAYIVGGAVRDILRGAPVHDWDVTTDATPEMTKQMFSNFPTYDIGIKHGTVTVNVDGEMIEITTFRTDGEYKDSRHPEQVVFTSDLREDLLRRDFTINAMAMDISKNIEDPYHGMRDLADNLIRAVGVPINRFTEDALRIMRAFRFSATLSYDVEVNTLEAAAACAFRLENISRERINEEWKKLLTAELCSKTLLTMKKYGIFAFLFPNLALEEQDLEHLDALPNVYTLRSAAFFKNCPPSEIDTASARINFTKAELAEVKTIIEAYRGIIAHPEQNLRRFCYKHQGAAAHAATLAVHDFLLPRDILSVIRAICDDPRMIWSRKELKINGNDILSIYSVPPRSLSTITEALVLKVVDLEIPNEREALLSAVKQMI